MSMEIEELARPRELMSSIPRPTSLHVANLAFTVPIIDQTSYSPFPTFPGSRSHDPYGLNAFLQQPDVDASWTPPTAPTSSEKSLGKRKSLSALRKPSPLSQPPVSALGETSPVTRKRSNSVDSTSGTPPAIVEPPKTPKSLGRKSLRGYFTRKGSSFGHDNDEDIPPVPRLPPPIARAMTAPSLASLSSVSSDDIDPTTPMSSRSNSDYSSASSTSSSEGVKTPLESITIGIDVGLAGVKLADALASAEAEKKGKGKSWRRGWLGTKKGAKIDKGISSVSIIPSTVSPNTSTTTLATPNIPSLTLTPSPSITSSRISEKHWPSEQLRRSSFRKMNQLRAPSPHPLALHLRRQYCNLPNEVAFSIQSGQKVFPLSVNLFSPTPDTLNPAQGGLLTSLGIKAILSRLDRGEIPPPLTLRRKDSVPVVLARPRGVSDFIERPPFESRNIVWFGEGVYSEVSMARKGFGIWDLDFSGYLLGLAELDERGMMSRGGSVGGGAVLRVGGLPRGSVGELIDEVLLAGDEGAVIKVEDERDGQSDVGDKVEGDSEAESTPTTEEGEILITTPGDSLLDMASLALVEIPSVVVELPTPELEMTGPIVLEVPVAVKVEEPVSSFRSARQVKTWVESDDEESDEDEDEDEEDAPLASIPKRPSLSMPIAASSFARAPLPTHTRSSSQTTEPSKSQGQSHPRERQSASSRDNQHLAAMAEVARARERREANDKGLVERRAESGRRTSMVDLRPTVADIRSKSLPRGERVDGRTRVMSSYDLTGGNARPQAGARQRSVPPTKDASSGMGSRRYHSFYERSSAFPPVNAAPQPAPPSQMNMTMGMGMGGGMYTHPGMMAFPQQTMGMGMPMPMAMGGMGYHPQMMPGYMMNRQVMGVPFGYAPGNRTSLVVPNSNRRPPIA